MVVPEIPMAEGDEVLKIREQMVFGVQPLSADQTPRGEVCIRPFAAGVRDDIVHMIVMPLEVVQSLVQLLKGGRLLPPPALPLDAEGAVDARRPAEGEKSLATDCIHLPAHQVDDVGSDEMDLSTIPLADGVTIEQIEIFMIAVHKRNGKGQRREGLQVAPERLCRPDPAEVPRNDHIVVLGEIGMRPAERPEPSQIGTVGIPCNKYHNMLLQMLINAHITYDAMSREEYQIPHQMPLGIHILHDHTLAPSARQEHLAHNHYSEQHVPRLLLASSLNPPR